MNERRYDPASDTWVTVSAQRQDRTFLPAADECPLCPTRPGGPTTEIPRAAFEVAVFDNRFPALAPDFTAPASVAPPYASAAAAGRCEVVVYSDAHEGSLATLPTGRLRLLIDVWADRHRVLGAQPEVGYVMAFENRGDAVGATLHHPHGQVYAYPEVPPRVATRLAAARRYLERTGRCVHCDVVAAEVDGPRVVLATADVIAFVPFAPRLPYEVHVVPRAHQGTLGELPLATRDELADVLARLVEAYDRLFGFPLPYVMAIHQRPTDGGDWDAIAHTHFEFTPLHRSADKLKYLAGSELAAGAFLTDRVPEDAAAELRERLR